MKCMIEGCDREAKVRGWCKPHYVREWKKVNVSIEAREGNEMYNTWANKKHKRVPEWDSFEQFKKDVGPIPGAGYRLCRKDTKAIWGPGNVEWRVVEIPKEPGESMKDYVARQARKSKLRDNYGLTQEQYDAMFEAQGGVCAICKEPERSRRVKRLNLSVDHCHKTGKIRGLLCSGCNTAIGHFYEDIEVMIRAKKYLEHHSENANEVTQVEHQHPD